MLGQLNKIMLRKINRLFKLFGLNIPVFINTTKSLPKFIVSYLRILKSKSNDKNFKIRSLTPVLNDWNSESGTASGHYFHQDLHIAQLIYEKNPDNHLDIGSRIDGFVAHVASFRKINVMDIRELNIDIKNIIFKKVDLMSLNQNLYEEYSSISCLHALEHFGLGRYGDKIDYWGFEKGFKNISSLLKKNGTLYLSVPIGPQRIEFNAHRVFKISYLISLIRDNYTIKTFSYVNDKGDFFKNQKLNKLSIDNNFGCNYGCGIFELVKL